MTEHQDSQNFADLFKRYRLRSQIDTLSRFGDLFAEEGMIYENSLFTRWQKGQRIPRDRRTLLALIRLFVKHKGITTLEEANGLLKVVGLCDLSSSELKTIGYLRQKEENKHIQFKNSDSILQIQPISISEFWKSSFIKFFVFLVIFNSVWNLKINLSASLNSFESYLWAISYSSISLSAYLFFYFGSKRTNLKVKESVWFRARRLYSYGLLSQGLGLLTWTYYNLTGTEIPYPSFADLGYFGTAIFYLLASFYVLIGCVPWVSQFLKYKKSIVVLSPLLMFLITTLNYMQIFTLSLDNQIKLALDHLYPFLEISSIFIVLCGLIFLDKKYSLIKSRIFLLLTALVAHFIAEYIFVISVKNLQYTNGNYNDFMYLLAHALMGISITGLIPLAKDYRFDFYIRQSKERITKSYNNLSFIQFNLLLQRVMRYGSQ